MRTLQYIVLTFLTLHLIMRGIIPALTTIDTDFPNYYVSAQLVIERNTARFYDDRWFQEQIYAHGINQAGKFSPYPPVTALVMLPLTGFESLQALRLWTILNIAVLVGSIVLLVRITKKDFVWCSLLFLASGHALVNNFRFGQFYLVLTFLLLASFVLWQRHRHAAAGMLLGVGSALKYFPVVFLPLHGWRKEGKIIWAALAAITAIYTVSLGVFGNELHYQFLEKVLGAHLEGNIQNPFSSIFQSWNSLLGRLFVYDEQFNTHPLLNLSVLKPMLLLTLYCIVGGFTMWGVSLAHKSNNAHLQYALITIAALLLLPASATYHFLPLILPIALLLSSVKVIRLEEKVILGSFIAIGFIPYSFTHQFETNDSLLFLAYPRLWLMTLIYVFTLILIRKRGTW